MEEGQQEALDLILSQSADGRHGAAAHGGAASLQLQNKVQHTQKQSMCLIMSRFTIERAEAA